MNDIGKNRQALMQDVKNYLIELDTQSPIVPTSHITLIRIAKKYGKEQVSKEINKQLKLEKKNG